MCQNDTWIVTFLGLWYVLFARESITYRQSDSLCTLGTNVCSPSATTEWGSQKGSPESVQAKQTFGKFGGLLAEP